MRITWTWVVAIVLTFAIIFAWYISQPIIISLANKAEGITQDLGVNTTGSAQTYTLIRLAGNVAPPFLIICVWVWALISGQAEDWRGEEYYG